MTVTAGAGIPSNLTAIVFYRNTELVPEAPATWEEMVSVAQDLTNADEEMWGWRSSGAGWAPNVTAVMVHQAGGNIDNMDDEASRAALQYMYDWVHTHGITPPTIVQEDPGAIRPHVSVGNVPMYWDMENGLGYVLGLDGNQMTKETLVASRWPAGPAGDNTLIMLGGIGIPKWNIKNKDEAFEFVRFFIQKEHAKQLCIFKNYTPARNSLYDDADIQEMVSITDSGPGFAEIIRDGIFRCPYIGRHLQSRCPASSTQQRSTQNLQYRPGRTVHGRRLHSLPARSRHTSQHGWPRPRARQRLLRTPMAQRQI